MDHYVNLHIEPDPEFGTQVLMNALYSKLHRALTDLAVTDIGVSFPNYSLKPRALGDLLRLHGTRQSLSLLMDRGWLKGVRDHVSCSEVSPVPPEVNHCLVKRIQKKGNAERLRRRHAKRHGISMEKARATIPDSVEQRVDLPFAMLNSASTGHKFPLFIEHGEPQETPTPGEFNSYGLSTTGTIPWF